MKKIVMFVFFLLVVFFIVQTNYVSKNILERIPHSQDEQVFLFQAKTYKSTHIFLKSLPENIRRFFDHEFIVNNDKWYGKYPPGFPVLLTIGFFLNAPWLINICFGAVSLILIFFLTKDLLSIETALLSSVFYVISPLCILQSSSYLSHTTTLFFTLLFIISLVKIYIKTNRRYHRWTALLYSSLGAVYLIRPYNAVILISICIFIVFFYFKKTLYVKRFSSNLYIFLIFFVVNGIYNFILTGSFFKMPFNAYSLWDFPGFGQRGIEWPEYFGIQKAISNIVSNFNSASELVFTFPFWLSLFFILFSFREKSKICFTLISFLVFQIVFYFFHFGAGTFFGPRYWYETIWILFILTSEGIINILNIIRNNCKTCFSIIYFSLIIALFYYSTLKNSLLLSTFKGYNCMSEKKLPEIKKPSIVIVLNSERNWQAYGQYFYKQSFPLQESDIIFARDGAIHNVPKDLQPISNQVLVNFFKNRYVYYVNGECNSL